MQPFQIRSVQDQSSLCVRMLSSPFSMHKPFPVPLLNYPLEATMTLPGSKSQANRAIVCAALGSGVTILKNATPCDDVAVMVKNLQILGFDVQWLNEHTGELRIKGGIPHSNLKPHISHLDCHNAGTTLRFLASVCALVPGTWVLTGNAHMLKRPIHDLIHALRSLGAVIEDTEGALPLTIHGGTLKGGTVTLKADISSQYLSSLLLIAPVLSDGLTITLEGPLASAGYVSLTQKVMRDFGASIEIARDTFVVSAKGYTSPPSYEVEGDWSSAGPWLTLSAMTGSRFHFTNISRTSEQSDRLLPGVIDSMRRKGDITIDCHEIPDQLMNLAVLATCRMGVTTFVGARNLRHKECDRLHVLTTELQKCGVKISEHEDGVTVHGHGPYSHLKPHTSPIVLDPHDDHRMVMSFALIGLLRGNVSIKHSNCVVKSYPEFLSELSRILLLPRPIAIIGMRGAGKSSLARRLAKRLSLVTRDSDHACVEKYGPIRAYVEKHGWPMFREREAEMITECLKPGTVLACGGGATTNPRVRELLKESAICLWLQASEAVLLQRLGNGKRPPLTSLPLKDEVKQLLVERTPEYAETAHITIPAHLHFARQIPFIVRELRRFVRSHDVHTSHAS